MSSFWRSKANPMLLVNLSRADYFEIQGVKEPDDHKVCAYYSGVSKIIFKGSFEECNLFLNQIQIANALDERKQSKKLDALDRAMLMG